MPTSEAARVRLQHQRAEAARVRFGQQAHDVCGSSVSWRTSTNGICRCCASTSCSVSSRTRPRSVSTRPSLRPLRFCSASARLQLLLGDDLVLEQQLAEANLLAADLLAHGAFASSLPLLRAARRCDPVGSLHELRPVARRCTTSGRSRITSSTVLRLVALAAEQPADAGHVAEQRRLVVLVACASRASGRR